ncbi:MAG: hypothetical protein LBD85_00675 [Oscillospiraceae bacterium]|jgi:membrane-associated protease RseP (regulator of RpoE activity)|nr:hypothetical protein [Oscillospiraceae bacterium]
MKFKMTVPFALAFALFAFIDDSGLVWISALAAAIHELGHRVAIKLFRAKVTEFRLELTGAAIYYDTYRLNYAADAVIAFAGPLAGIIAALIGARLGYVAFAGVSAGLSLINLLPASCLDGGRILRAITATVTVSETPMIAAHAIVCGAFLLGGFYVFNITGGNWTCIALAVFLLFSGLNAD